MRHKDNFSSLNSLWATLIVEELLRCGVEHFCVAPGSRSAPLAIATAENPSAKSTIYFDERGLGFYALGLCVSSQKPVVIITTSASAVANLFPAIIEANKKKLPLVIITADRPPELRASGANQTIDQIKIFGDYVRFFFDMPCPTIDIPPETVLSTIDQAIFRAKGELPGPVHLNCMFREPLSSSDEDLNNFSLYLLPIKNWQNSLKPYTEYQKPLLKISPEILQKTAALLKSVEHGVIVVGKIGGLSDQEAVLALAQKLNWPIFADITSGLRLGHKQKQIIHYFDHILNVDQLAHNLQITGVLHLGGRLTSARYYKAIKKTQPRDYIMVLNHPLRNDPNHVVTLRLQCPVKEFCQTISPYLSHRPPTKLLKTLQKANQACEKVLENRLFLHPGALSEPAVAHLLSKLIPKNSGLFIGNSMPIRDLNLFAANRGKIVNVTANRGASGIDGNIATASGFAKGLNAPSTAILGDLAFLHDLNSLYFLQNPSKPFVLIVLNNNGGAIFSFLPVSSIKTGFTQFFTAPHHLTFEHAAKLFKLAYKSVKTTAGFIKAYQTAVQTPKTTIIEVCSKTPVNTLVYQQIAENITRILNNL